MPNCKAYYNRLCVLFGLLLQDSWEDEEDEKKDEEKLDSAPVAKLKPKTKLQEKIAEKEVRFIRGNKSLN